MRLIASSRDSSPVIVHRKNKNPMRKVLTTAIAAGLLCIAPAAALDLVTNGQADMVIVGNTDDPAVQDLQTFLKGMSGAELPVLPLATEPLPERCIVVGKRLVPGYTAPALDPQAYNLRVLGSRLIIHGGANWLDDPRFGVVNQKDIISPLGVQFGIYALLDDILGIRFLTRDVTYIPEMQTVRIPGDLNVIGKPSIRDRQQGTVGNTASMDDAAWRRRNRVGHDLYGHANHDIYRTWLPPEEFFEQHPEWYPMDKQGSRKPDTEWLCWSNSEMLAKLIPRVKRHMATNSPLEVVSIGQGDGYVACHCRECRRLVEDYGGNAAPMVAGLNRILEETSKDYPEHTIAAFAYLGTDEAPVKGDKRLVPHPNLYITFVRMADAIHDFDSGSYNPKVRDKFLTWAKLTDNLQVWSWSINFQNFMMPFPNMAAMARDTSWFAPHAKGFMHQYYGGGDWFELREWLWARMMWNSEQNIEALQQEFIRLYYGTAAAPLLLDYLKSAQDRAQVYEGVLSAVFNTPQAIIEALYPPPLLDTSLSQFEAALAAADSEVYRERVRKTLLSSLAVAFFAGTPKPLQVVSVDGKNWLLPGGDASLAPLVDGLSDHLSRFNTQEGGGAFWGRRLFLDKAGGRMDPILDNAALQVAFCPNLDGSLVSLHHKPSGRNLLAPGPADEGRLGGIHHRINTRWGATEWTFQKPQDHAVVARGSALVGAWFDAEALFHEKRFSLSNDVLRVEAVLWTDPAKAWVFKPGTYGKPPYNYSLDEPFYTPHVSVRLAVTDKNRVLAAWRTADRSLPMTGAAQNGFMVDVKRIEKTLNQPVTLVVARLQDDLGAEITLDRDAWERVDAVWAEDGKALVINLSGAARTAKLGENVSLGGFSLKPVTNPDLPVAKVPELNERMETSRAIRVAADGSGDALSLDLAVAALPDVTWEGNWTIEVDAQADFGAGYGGCIIPETIIKAAGEHALCLRSVNGRAWINNTLQCSGPGNVNPRSPRMRVDIRGFRLSATARGGNGIANPGPHAIIADNQFENLETAIRLADYQPHPGLLIERNLFNQVGRAVGDSGAAHGGIENVPLIIRNNIFVQAGERSIHICNPDHTLVIGNTFWQCAMRVDKGDFFIIAGNLFIEPSAFVLIGEAGTFADNRFYPTLPPALPPNVGELCRELRFVPPSNAHDKSDWLRPLPPADCLKDAIPAGLPAGSEDFTGRPRIGGQAADIGAYEVIAEVK